MISYDAFKIAKRKNKEYKKAMRLIRIMVDDGCLSVAIFSNIGDDAINMLQRDGYAVEDIFGGTKVSWRQKSG